LKTVNVFAYFTTENERIEIYHKYFKFFFVSETYIVERMYEMWQMKSTTQHIDAEMAKFVNKAVKYSSCQTLGLTTFILCDIPRFLYLILEVMIQIVLI